MKNNLDIMNKEIELDQQIINLRKNEVKFLKADQDRDAAIAAAESEKERISNKIKILEKEIKELKK